MHPTDDELLALLNGEASGTSGDLTREHVAGCAACLRCLCVFRHEQEDDAALLRELDLPVPHVTAAAVRETARRRSRLPSLTTAVAALAMITGAVIRKQARRPSRLTSLAAAVAVLALVTAAAAAMPGSPLRAWFAQVLAPKVASAPRVPEPSYQPAAGGIQITPGDDFTLELSRPQTTGQIRIAYTDQAFVTARAVGGVVVYHLKTAKLVLDNRTPADRYDITFPRRLLRARIVVADRTVFQTNLSDHAPRVDTITIALSTSTTPKRKQP